ncbi:hypothetical protein HBA54_13395 [Pelagibius litoralis]|uniref:Uncharacterized protein n=1 Tax=Pelagibius litoralis TaxID=374515 RepID=A0A967EYB6_9PROT|nr:hypothetical protein [Pelagibius litoralis]NIA69590.1 hypothetical protein [Pelagibius litoralis]
MFRRTDPGARCRDINCSTIRSRALQAASIFSAALAMAAPGQALADYGSALVTELDLAVIEVASDGQGYTTVSGSSPAINGMMRLSLDAHKYGKVKSWAAWPSIQDMAIQKKQFPEFKYSESYSIGDRPKTVGRDLPFSIPLQAYKAYAKDACNQLASRLRSKHGKTDEEIFAVDREIPVVVRGELTWEMSGLANDDPPPAPVPSGAGNPGGNSKVKPVTIVCQKTPLPQAPPTANDPVPQVQSVNLVVDGQGTPVGECRLILSGIVTTNLPNTQVKFRFRDQDGKESGVKTVVTGPNAWVKYGHIQTLPSGDLNTGEVRVIGVSEEFSSDWKNYKVDCRSPAVQLEVLATTEKVMHQGETCPASAKIYGVVKGRGDIAGAASLFADGKLKALKQYDLEDKETTVIEGDYDLDWQNAGASQQSVKFSMNVANNAGDLIGQLEVSETFECSQGVPDGLAGDIPLPKTVKLVVVPQGTVVQGDYVCPAEVRMIAGVVSGKDPLSGKVVYFVDALLNDEKDFSLGASQQQGVIVEHPLDWSGGGNGLLAKADAGNGDSPAGDGDSPPEQKLNFKVKVLNQLGFEIGAAQQMKTFACKKIATAGLDDGAPGGLATALPPKPNVFSVPVGEIQHNGNFCPARIQIYGTLKGRGAFAGSAGLVMNTATVLTKGVSIDDKETVNVAGVFDLTWKDSETQLLEFGIDLANANDDKVDSVYKTINLECRKPGVVGIGQGAGGYSSAKPKPTNSQQAGKPAAVGGLMLPQAPAFAIQAPKGNIKSGQIQLSGGKAGAKYVLRFYRKAGNGFKLIRSAKLPRAMTGPNASFDVKALTGGRNWRLEVCAAGQKGKKACKTTDFQLPLSKAPAGVKKTPKKPAKTKVFILPGMGG